MNSDKQKAFTLIEVMIVMAVILILAGAMLTGGKYLKVRAERQLTQSAIEIIVTAMEQYYEQTKSFPPMINNETELQAVLSASSVTVVGGGTLQNEFWRSSSAYYLLTRVPQSKAILESLSERLVSGKASNNIRVQLEIQMAASEPVKTYDWVCWVDAWGQLFRYTYSAGDVFPAITSAGPDKQFGTDDDLSSK
jgi:prepilin-type N-terminal cleavage/methylation domain-containing protein